MHQAAVMLTNTGTAGGEQLVEPGLREALGACRGGRLRGAGRLAAVALQAGDRDGNADERGGKRAGGQAPAPSAGRLRRIERPRREADQDEPDEGGEQTGRAHLLAQHPHQPGHRGIDREGQQLPQRLHPGAGPRQAADELRGKRQRQERQRQAEPERQDHGQRGRGRLGEGEADGRPHERRGAGRRHHRRQHAREERSGEPRAPRQAVAQALQRRSQMEYAGQAQPHGEQQIGQQRDGDRRLQLEAPPDLGAGGAHAEQHAPQRRERQRGRRRCRPAPCRRTLAPRPAGLLDQGQHLDGEHRKDAGHQVEDHAADEGEQCGLQHRCRAMRPRAARVPRR